MKNWLKALLAETILSAWWILSSLSTLCTFFFPSWSGKPRIISAFSAALGFAIANFRVFKKQEAHLQQLEVNAASHVRTSSLTIRPGDGSRYILCPAGGVPHADFNAGYFEFILMVENTGRRNSIVVCFDVEIVELGRKFQNLTPEEGRNGVQGRHCQHGMNPERILSRTRIIRINAESGTDNGNLLFLIPGITLQEFVDAGLMMHGNERKFGPLHCRLTLTDTNGSSATEYFELHEQ